MSGVSYVSEEDLNLLKDIKDLMNNTHQYDSELYGELFDTINDLSNGDKMHENDLIDLFKRCHSQLSNCHCDDHETCEELFLRLHPDE